MTQPTKPRQTPLDLYNQAGNDTGGESTINAVNDATQFLRDSVAFRETSPDSIDTVQDITQYDLQPGAIVRLSRDSTALITPDNVPAFADGGYPYKDELFYATIGQATERYPSLSQRDGVIVGTDGDFRFIGNPTLDSEMLRPHFEFPTYPFKLGFRFRGIAQAKDLSVYVTNRSSSGVSRRDSAFTMRPTFPFGGGVSAQAYIIMPYGRVPGTPEEANAGVLREIPNLIGTDWQDKIIVFEYKIGVPSFVSNRWIATSSCVFGFYDTIQEAYADTGASIAFSCLDPDHPNYLATLTYTGRYRTGVNGTTAYQAPGIATNRLYYVEILAGSRLNDINNFAPEDIPVADDDFALPPNA